MKYGLLVLILGLALAGCGKKEAPSSAPATTTAVAGRNLPAECEDYVKTVTACVEKVGASNPAVGTFKQQMEATRTQWEKVADKSTLAPACKQAADAFKQAATALKC